MDQTLSLKLTFATERGPYQDPPTDLRFLAPEVRLKERVLSAYDIGLLDMLRQSASRSFPPPSIRAMEVDPHQAPEVALAPDNEETWLFVMAAVLADLRSQRPMTKHPDDAAATSPAAIPPELRILPDPDSTSPYLRDLTRTRLAAKSALDTKHAVAQERRFDRREVDALCRIRAQEDGLREPCPGEKDEHCLTERKLKAIHSDAIHSRCGNRSALYRDQEARLRRAQETLDLLQSNSAYPAL